MNEKIKELRASTGNLETKMKCVIFFGYSRLAVLKTLVPYITTNVVRFSERSSVKLFTTLKYG